MTYRTAVFKRNAELLIMLPFVLLGKLAGKIFPLKTRHTVFLFFPSADIGGSVKVNADITACMKYQKPLIIFSKNPENNQFHHFFEMEGVRIIDLHKYIDNKWFHFVNLFFRGVLASWINQADKPVVFGGESIFFYKVIPHLKKGSKKVELCHLNTWISYSLAFIKYMDCRICSTPNLKREVGRLYKENNIPGHYFEKIFFIDNKVNIPLYREITNPVLEVLYAGRGAKQKRVHLIAEIAKQMHDMNRPVHFSFVGDVKEFVPETIQAHCTLFGSINKEAELDKIYQQSDVLILTSSYEGLPIAIMEMMARGKVIVSTAVDGIPDYITHKENGLLITESDETKIVESGINLLDLLINDRELQKEIGKKSYAYAVAHFSGELFCDSFHKMLQHEK